MPCNDGCGPTTYDIRNANAANLLCRLMTKIEKEGLYRQFVPKDSALEDWWNWHKQEDDKKLAEERSRLQRGKLKAQALNKLTEEEREALGIRG